MQISRYPLSLLISSSFIFVSAAFAQTPINLSVNSVMDIYQAGGYVDNSGGFAPAFVSFSAAPGQVVAFSHISGFWTCQSNLPYYQADGTMLSGNCLSGGRHMNPVGPFSGYDATDFAGALAGVFLEDQLPRNAPPGLRFYVNDDSQGGIATSFFSLRPRIGQIFFIGDGLTATGSGAHQVFQVPPTATHLYLGSVDSCNDTTPSCFTDNAGTLQVSGFVSPLGHAPTL